MEKIIIYPLGGIVKFNMPLNTSKMKELLIIISGPLFQFIAYYILLKYYRNDSLVKLYHYNILLFNLLPIYPLDGGKLLNLFISNIIPYKKSLQITITISYLIVIFLLIINYQNIQLNLIIMSAFLIYKIIKEQKQIKYNYNKFLLERYLNKYNFSKSKIINNENDFFRNKRHLIKENDKYYLEEEYLRKKYKKM